MGKRYQGSFNSGVTPAGLARYQASRLRRIREAAQQIDFRWQDAVEDLTQEDACQEFEAAIAKFEASLNDLVTYYSEDEER